MFRELRTALELQSIFDLLVKKDCFLANLSKCSVCIDCPLRYVVIALLY